jgi:hypothetical protein
VAVALQARHKRPADETRRAGDEDAHRSSSRAGAAPVDGVVKGDQIAYRDPHVFDCK